MMVDGLSEFLPHLVQWVCLLLLTFACGAVLLLLPVRGGRVERLCGGVSFVVTPQIGASPPDVRTVGARAPTVSLRALNSLAVARCRYPTAPPPR